MLRRDPLANCILSPYLLHQETYIPVTNGYILLPLRQITIDINCDDGLETITIHHASLIQGSRCKVFLENTELYLPTTQTLNKIVNINVSFELPFDKNEIENLRDRLIPLPQKLDQQTLANAKLGLDNTLDLLEQIKSRTRINNWKEKTVDVLHIAGYCSLTIIGIYVMYKCGLFKIIRKCLPKKLCLFCIKNQITNEPVVVTYERQPRRESEVDIKPYLNKNVKLRL